MGIFEFIGELISPGPVGSIEVKNEDNGNDIRQKFIPIRFAISLIMIVAIEYLFINNASLANSLNYILKVNAGLAIYLLISYFINIKPDYGNLGWIPFIFNNPFRISDNINRFLVILMLFFMPGKYISRSIVQFFRSFNHNAFPVL